MLKDIDYKDAVHVFYTLELCIKRRLIPRFKLGTIEVREERIRRYVVVNPEFYLEAHDGVAMFEPLMPNPHIAAKVIWGGAYFINQDLNLISSKDIYECWIDTVNEILAFNERSGFLGNYAQFVPTPEQVQPEIDEFLRSLQGRT